MRNLCPNLGVAYINFELVTRVKKLSSNKNEAFQVIIFKQYFIIGVAFHAMSALYL